MSEIAEIRDQILTATLSHVIFDGWTRRALDAGAKDAGYGDALTGRAFPGGVKDLTKHYFDYANRRMLAELANRNLDELPVRERISTAIRIRLVCASRSLGLSDSPATSLHRHLLNRCD